MRDLTFTDVERLRTADADETCHMDEDTFRAFYERTARPVWAYLSRLTGDPQQADDLLQETYYRFLRADRGYASDAHRRNYLFRIATNLVRDGRRRRRPELVAVPEETDRDALRSAEDVAGRTQLRADLGRAMASLSSREQALLWLAYANGSSHEEIAKSLGLKTSSIKLLLFRARRRLAETLRGGEPRGQARDGIRQ
jgi:RNA polymerase sigma-70 factor (ECF subfamily)